MPVQRDFLGLLVVHDRKLVARAAGDAEEFVKLGVDSRVSRCSARWMNSVMTHLATVAMDACHGGRCVCEVRARASRYSPAGTPGVG
jgi:hypothetical protein